MTNLTLSRPTQFTPNCFVSNDALPWRNQPKRGEDFGQQSGILKRPISDLSEGDMATRAVKALFERERLNSKDCCGLVIASSSLHNELGDMISPELENNEDFKTRKALWPPP
jgi:hypothetical protein